MLKEKFKALTIHFALSIVVVSFFISLAIYLWYPAEYIGLTRFKELALLVIFVDLVMGPILTFVVFNTNKKSLKLDLAVIAILQLSALGYGIYNLFQDHPVFITFNQDRFTVINAKYAQPNKAKYSEYQVSKLKSAKFAYAKLPEKEEEKQELLLDSLSGGADLAERSEYYEPYESHIENIISKGLDSKLILSAQNSNKEVQKFIRKNDIKIDDLAFLPINSSSKYAIIVLDKKTAMPIDTIDVDPWKLSKK